MSPPSPASATLDPAVAEVLGRAPVRAGATVSVSAGAEPVWALLSDPDGWSDWYAGVKDSAGANPLKVGSRLSFRAGPAAFQGKVDELVEQRKLLFSGKSTGATASYMFRLEPEGRRGTRVSAAVAMSGLAVMAAKPVMQAIAERSVVRWLDALAAAAPAQGGRRLR